MPTWMTSLFSLDVPKGYALKVSRPTVTEKEMIDYLGALADVNDRTFPDQAFAPSIIVVCNKPKKDRTAAEQKLFDMQNHYIQTGRCLAAHRLLCQGSHGREELPLLGQRGQTRRQGPHRVLVQAERRQGCEDYRVLYGDLSVKDIAAQDLPLPVGP